MATFVVEFLYNVDRAGRQELHPAHAANLERLAERGVLVLGGPLVDDNGGLLVYEVADREELRALLEDEPYVRGGIVAETRISQWSPRRGSWVTALDRAAGRAGG
jgi:uncharacterized protein YciI